MSRYVLPEQTSGLGRPSVRQGQRSHQQPPASPHRAGHSAGFHPEDQPFLTDELEEDEWYSVTRPHSSARRYTQGETHYTVRYGAPPAKQAIPSRRSQRITQDEHYEPKPRRRVHWLVYVGFVCFVGISGWVGFTALSTWWQGVQDNWNYGNPRTYQTDAVVGHSDSSSSPSHFMAENLRGQIIVVELPGGDPSKGRSYTITSIPGNTDNPPVKVMFEDMNHDGKLDMLVEIGDPGSEVSVFLFNNGSQFVSEA